MSEVIKMNGAGFVTSFVLSLELGQFVQYCVENNIYRVYGDKQTAMATELWNLAHGIAPVKEKAAVNKNVILPKAVNIVKPAKKRK